MRLADPPEPRPGLAQLRLQMVNWAFFGARAPVTSIFDAVRYLGTDVLSGLLLSAQIFAAFAAGSAPSFSAATLRDRSLKAAGAARRLATVTGAREEIYAATLLCDVGQLVLSCAAPIAFERILRTAKGRTAAQHEFEREAFRVSHAEIGGHLLGLWGLPLAIVEAVAFHHRPSAAAGAPSMTLAAGARSPLSRRRRLGCGAAGVDRGRGRRSIGLCVTNGVKKALPAPCMP